MSQSTTDLTVREAPPPSGVMTNDEIDRTYRLADGLAKSGMFKDARQAGQAFAKILLGQDLGLSPTQAMTSIHVVEGKPELSANLQAQLVRGYVGPEGERYDFRVVEHSDEACAVRFLRRDHGGEWVELGVERFTIEDARRAGLAGKNVWRSYPRNMLWARCISNGVNFHCPEVARGLRVYHEGEIGGDAEPVAAAPEPEPAAPAAEAVPLLDDDAVLGLTEIARTVVEAGEKPGRVVTKLVALGAQDGSSVQAALRSLPATAGDEARDLLNALLDAATADAETVDATAEDTQDADDARAEVAA